MFGIFKKLFSKSASAPPIVAPIMEKAPLSPVPAAAQKPMALAPAPAPLSNVPVAALSPASVPTAAPRQINGKIELPLNEILSRLPNDLAAQVLSQPGVMFSLSTGLAMDQLRTGAVRIPFSQLRQGSPPGTFLPNGLHDDSLIDLPLPMILAALGPAGFARRPDQKKAAVPDDVTGIFGAKHSRVNHGAPKVDATLQSRSVPVVEKDQRKEAAPTIPMPEVKLQSRPDSVAAAIPLPVPPKPVTPVVPLPVAPKAPAPLPFATARPTPPPSAAPPPPSGGTVLVNVEAVSAAWPDPVRDEIQKSDLGIAMISIPVNRLEAGMKTGRVIFTWAELRGWLNSPVPPSPNGESKVELPLKVMAPLFLAKQSPRTQRKVVSGGANLPDLFSGLIRPVAPALDVDVEPPLPPPPPAPAPVAAPNILGEILGQPSKTTWTPQEIAQRILSLPGVAGAMLASSDGLLVAGQMPEPLSAETMAAFMPRIFTHTVLCAGEVQLGTLRALRLSAGPAACIICKAGNLYLAVLGQPGQTLPEAVLEQLAVELAQQNH